MDGFCPSGSFKSSVHPSMQPLPRPNVSGCAMDDVDDDIVPVEVPVVVEQKCSKKSMARSLDPSKSCSICMSIGLRLPNVPAIFVLDCCLICLARKSAANKRPKPDDRSPL